MLNTLVKYRGHSSYTIFRCRLFYNCFVIPNSLNCETTIRTILLWGSLIRYMTDHASPRANVPQLRHKAQAPTCLCNPVLAPVSVLVKTKNKKIIRGGKVWSKTVTWTSYQQLLFHTFPRLMNYIFVVLNGNGRQNRSSGAKTWLKRQGTLSTSRGPAWSVIWCTLHREKHLGLDYSTFHYKIKR